MKNANGDITCGGGGGGGGAVISGELKWGWNKSWRLINEPDTFFFLPYLLGRWAVKSYVGFWGIFFCTGNSMPLNWSNFVDFFQWFKILFWHCRNLCPGLEANFKTRMQASHTNLKSYAWLEILLEQPEHCLETLFVINRASLKVNSPTLKPLSMYNAGLKP